MSLNIKLEQTIRTKLEVLLRVNDRVKDLLFRFMYDMAILLEQTKIPVTLTFKLNMHILHKMTNIEVVDKTYSSVLKDNMTPSKAVIELWSKLRSIELIFQVDCIDPWLKSVIYERHSNYLTESIVAEGNGEISMLTVDPNGEHKVIKRKIGLGLPKVPKNEDVIINEFERSNDFVVKTICNKPKVSKEDRGKDEKNQKDKINLWVKNSKCKDDDYKEVEYDPSPILNNIGEQKKPGVTMKKDLIKDYDYIESEVNTNKVELSAECKIIRRNLLNDLSSYILDDIPLKNYWDALSDDHKEFTIDLFNNELLEKKRNSNVVLLKLSDDNVVKRIQKNVKNCYSNYKKRKTEAKYRNKIDNFDVNLISQKEKNKKNSLIFLRLNLVKKLRNLPLSQSFPMIFPEEESIIIHYKKRISYTNLTSKQISYDYLMNAIDSVYDFYDIKINFIDFELFEGMIGGFIDDW